MGTRRQDESGDALEDAAQTLRTHDWGRHPDLEASLRLLITEQRYTLSDVAPMFGVSRERVRQWCEHWGIGRTIPPHTVAVRRWNAVLDRFEALTPALLACERRQQRRALRERTRMLDRTERRAQMVAAILGTARELGRVPTIREMHYACFGRWPSKYESGPNLCAAWGKKHPNKMTGILAEIRVACGFPERGIRRSRAFYEEVMPVESIPTVAHAGVAHPETTR